MTDTPNTLKIKALELANHVGEKPGEVVARATAYHAWLSGAAAAPAGAGAANKPAGATTAAGTTKPGATAGATGTATTKPDPKAEAAKKAAAEAAKKAAEAAKKAATDAAAKEAKAGKGAAAKPGAANAQSVPGDTKAPGGKNTYQDVVDALCKVREAVGKDTALKILADDGGGVKSVRDLKPALYDAVVEGCENEISGEGGAAEDDGTGGAAGAEFEDPTAQPEVDELGLAVS